MAWKITFYNERVEKDTSRFPPGILASFLRITELIEEFGPISVDHTPRRLAKDCLKFVLKGVRV